MTIPTFILLCGSKRSGKDTIADYLSQKYNIKHYKISQKLKDCIKILFNIDDNYYENNKELPLETWNKSIREFMQFIGTEMFQYKIQELLPDINKNFWIKSFLDNKFIYNNFVKNDNNIVISDLRFLHEFNYIKKICKENNLNFIVIRVNNNNNNTEDLHISEKEYTDISYHHYINNNTTFENLYENIDQIMLKYTSKN